MLFELLVPSAQVGAIIGEGGAIIQSIRADSGCQIGIADQLVIGGPRVVSLTGTSPQVHTALKAVLRQLALDGGDAIIVQALVPEERVGAVIGRAGEVINSLRASSRAEIEVIFGLLVCVSSAAGGTPAWRQRRS